MGSVDVELCYLQALSLIFLWPFWRGIEKEEEEAERYWKAL